MSFPSQEQNRTIFRFRSNHSSKTTREFCNSLLEFFAFDCKVLVEWIGAKSKTSCFSEHTFPFEKKKLFANFQVRTADDFQFVFSIWWCPWETKCWGHTFEKRLSLQSRNLFNRIIRSFRPIWGALHNSGETGYDWAKWGFDSTSNEQDIPHLSQLSFWGEPYVRYFFGGIEHIKSLTNVGVVENGVVVELTPRPGETFESIQCSVEQILLPIPVWGPNAPLKTWDVREALEQGIPFPNKWRFSTGKLPIGSSSNNGGTNQETCSVPINLDDIIFSRISETLSSTRLLCIVNSDQMVTTIEFNECNDFSTFKTVALSLGKAMERNPVCVALIFGVVHGDCEQEDFLFVEDVFDKRNGQASRSLIRLKLHPKQTFHRIRLGNTDLPPVL